MKITPTLARALLVPLALALLAVAVATALPYPAYAATAPPIVDLDIAVTVEPATHHLAGTMRATVPPGLAKAGALRFLLHEALAVESLDPGTPVTRVPGEPQLAQFGINEEGTGLPDVPLATWSVKATADGPTQIAIAVAGSIHHPVRAEGEEYARSFSRTPGLISDEGVVLSGSTWWLPRFGDELVRFKLAIDLPADWDAVSEGDRSVHEVRAGRRHVTWDSREPMEEIHLVAARFTEYSRPLGAVTAYAFLRTPDPNLAGKYLEATAQYIAMYSELLGPYPFSKFALVENFWDTGYGMPSFTLLGSTIIRFPFILTSSYPHEILHNWWGNSVYVDYPTGNWCEGLTAYLADHMLKEGQGEGPAHRRDTLKNYTDHVRGTRDFALREFRSRHSSATEAVGYGKSLMLWHMVRQRIGDDKFRLGLSRFYRENKWKRATFEDLGRAFSGASGDDLMPMFAQWVTRAGAPELALEMKDGHAVVRQVQEGEPFVLDVPVATWFGDGRPPAITKLRMTGREATLDLGDQPLSQVAVDPGFDLFRRLDRNEIPPTLSELFGAERVTIILPTADDGFDPAAWQAVATAWSTGAAGDIKVLRADDNALRLGVLDSQFPWAELRVPGSSNTHFDEVRYPLHYPLQADRAVWVLGSKNPWATAIAPALDRRGITCDPSDLFTFGYPSDLLTFGDVVESVPRAGHSFVYVTRHPANPDLAVGWVGADLAAALPGLARKLPHYGKYSLLAFSGAEPTNVRKAQWPIDESPLVVRLGDRSSPLAPLAAGEPLTRPAPVFDPARLVEHVRFLSGPELAGRGVGSDGIRKAEDYIAAEFRAAGLAPGGDEGGWFETWIELNGPGGKPVELRNVIGLLKGSKPEWSRQSVVVMAHHDHLGFGWPDARAGNENQIHPGADDNASGVGVMLEVAKLLAGQLKPQRTIVFVATSGEEWDLKGSRRYVKSPHAWPADEALAMLSLDTVGRLGGNDILLLGAGTASEWMHIAMGVGFTTGVKSRAVQDQLGASDQNAFIDIGVPAVQVFAGANDDYHRPGDTVDKIDPAGLVKVATFTRETVAYLSEREQPLTSKIERPAATATQAPAIAPAPPAETGARRVTLGTVPEFSYTGPGTLVASLVPGSPAEAAGFQPGDIVLAIDGIALADLRAYSDSLRRYDPGDRITIRVRRAGSEIELHAILAAH